MIGADTAVPPEPDWLTSSATAAAIDELWAEHGASAVDNPTDDERPGGEGYAAAWSDLELEGDRRWRMATPDEQRRFATNLAILRRTRLSARLAALRARSGVRALVDISHAPPAPLLIDRLDPEGQTWLYGTGGSGKGTIAVSWIEQLVADGHRVLILDYEDHPSEWARRYFGLAGLAGADAVHHVSPLGSSWQGRRGPIWALAGGIRELADDLRSDVVVVDSVVPACVGSDPVEPATAGEYSAAMQIIGRPSLSLAHVTKAGDLAYPFGSVFFHNLARVTWSLVRDGPGALLTSRKANNYAPLGRFVVDTVWRDGRPVEVHERGYAAVLADRIEQVLVEPLTVTAIVARLNSDNEDGAQAIRDDSVRAALRRGIKARPSSPQRFTVAGEGVASIWRRVEV